MFGLENSEDFQKLANRAENITPHRNVCGTKSLTEAKVFSAIKMLHIKKCQGKKTVQA